MKFSAIWFVIVCMVPVVFSSTAYTCEMDEEHCRVLIQKGAIDYRFTKMLLKENKFKNQRD